MNITEITLQYYIDVLDQHYTLLLWGIFLAAAVVFVILTFISAPYGKQSREGWGPGLNYRLAWILWELPSFAVFGGVYGLGEHRGSPAALILFILWEIHYFHRTFIYPFRIHPKPGVSSPIILLIFACAFNALNSYLNARWLSHFGELLWQDEWLSDTRFILGIVLFVSGFVMAKRADAILRNLRKSGDCGYKIPQGWPYQRLSCPNYVGEMVEWLGFAIASWSWAGAAFFVFTFANLGPRAIANHRWYQEYFGSQYPVERKALIPWSF